MVYEPRVAGLAELYHRLLESDITESPWALKVSQDQALIVVHCKSTKLFGHIELAVLERSGLLEVVVASFEEWVKDVYRKYHLRDAALGEYQQAVTPSLVRHFTLTGMDGKQP